MTLKRRYNEINIEKFLPERIEFKDHREIRMIEIDNDVHIEIGKFKTFHIDHSEVVDLALRFAIGKHEFRKLAAQLIDLKKNKISI